MQPNYRKAKELLLNPHNSIEDIAAECGYPSADAFISEFVVREMETPEAYRARLPFDRKPSES